MFRRPRVSTVLLINIDFVVQMIQELMLASGVYDPSHVFPEAMKMEGAVQQASMAALRTVIMTPPRHLKEMHSADLAYFQKTQVYVCRATGFCARCKATHRFLTSIKRYLMLQ